MIVTHFGSKEFVYSKFKQIKNNHQRFNKPVGGLWTSPADSTNSWLHFCLNNNFNKEKLNNSFSFQINKEAKGLVVDKDCDLESLPTTTFSYLDGSKITIFDFEKMAKEFDYLHFKFDGGSTMRYDFDDWRTFYGWDCETVLVFNPNIIHSL